MTTIRSARPDERAALVELQRRASLANPGDRAALEAHPDAIDIPAEQFAAGQVFVAEVDGKVRGFSAYVGRGAGALDLDGLFVEPDWWRRGVARSLIADGAERARAAGVSAIHVIGNPHAREFYLSVGFVETGPAVTEFGPASAYVLHLVGAAIDTPAMAYDEQLADRIREAVEGEPGVSEKRMFGGLAFLVHGNMAVAASGQGGALVRVDPAESDRLTAADHVDRMVMRGRAMDGWLRVGPEAVDSDAALRRWIDIGLAYARSLPPK